MGGAALFFFPSFSLSRCRFLAWGGGRARTLMAAPVDLLAWCPRPHPEWPRALHKAPLLSLSLKPIQGTDGYWEGEMVTRRTVPITWS